MTPNPLNLVAVPSLDCLSNHEVIDDSASPKAPTITQPQGPEQGGPSHGRSRGRGHGRSGGAGAISGSGRKGSGTKKGVKRNAGTVDMSELGPKAKETTQCASSSSSS